MDIFGKCKRQKFFYGANLAWSLPEPCKIPEAQLCGERVAKCLSLGGLFKTRTMVHRDCWWPNLGQDAPRCKPPLRVTVMGCIGSPLPKSSVEAPTPNTSERNDCGKRLFDEIIRLNAVTGRALIHDDQWPIKQDREHPPPPRGKTV